MMARFSRAPPYAPAAERSSRSSCALPAQHLRLVTGRFLCRAGWDFLGGILEGHDLMEKTRKGDRISEPVLSQLNLSGPARLFVLFARF